VETVQDLRKALVEVKRIEGVPALVEVVIPQKDLAPQLARLPRPRAHSQVWPNQRLSPLRERDSGPSEAGPHSSSNPRSIVRLRELHRLLGLIISRNMKWPVSNAPFELDRRRGAELRRSLQNPHPESVEVAEQGLEEWNKCQCGANVM